jgi:hypothetical protein
VRFVTTLPPQPPTPPPRLVFVISPSPRLVPLSFHASRNLPLSLSSIANTHTQPLKGLGSICKMSRLFKSNSVGKKDHYQGEWSTPLFFRTLFPPPMPNFVRLCPFPPSLHPSHYAPSSNVATDVGNCVYLPVPCVIDPPFLLPLPSPPTPPPPLCC